MREGRKMSGCQEEAKVRKNDKDEDDEGKEDGTVEEGEGLGMAMKEG